MENLEWESITREYKDDEIDVINEYSRIYGTRYSPDIYFDERYSDEFIVNWEVMLPENCEEIIQISFDNRQSWITLSGPSTEERPVEFNRPDEYIDYFVIRQILVIQDIQLLKIEERPMLDWFEIQDTYYPVYCNKKIMMSVQPHGEVIVCLDEQNIDFETTKMSNNFRVSTGITLTPIAYGKMNKIDTEEIPSIVDAFSDAGQTDFDLELYNPPNGVEVDFLFNEHFGYVSINEKIIKTVSRTLDSVITNKEDYEKDMSRGNNRMEFFITKHETDLCAEENHIGVEIKGSNLDSCQEEQSISITVTRNNTHMLREVK